MRVHPGDGASDGQVARVFVAHVAEDSGRAEALVRLLRDSGLDVWWSQDSIRVGRRWRDEIRGAIDSGGAFVACFSEHSERKRRSYMREELLQGIEQLRLLPTQRAWFIPVVLHGASGVDLSSYRISDVETLADLQYVDEGGDLRATAVRIVEAIAAEAAPEAVARMGRRLRQAEAQASLALTQLEFGQGRAIAAARVAAELAAAPHDQAAQIAETMSAQLRGVAAVLTPPTLASGFGAGSSAINNVAVGPGDEPVVVWSNRDGRTFGAVLKRHHTVLLPELPIENELAPELVLSVDQRAVLAVPEHGKGQAFLVPESGSSSWREITQYSRASRGIRWRLPAQGPLFRCGDRLYRLVPRDDGTVEESAVFGSRHAPLRIDIDGLRDVAVSNNGRHLIYLTVDRVGCASRESQRHPWTFGRRTPLLEGFSLDDGKMIVSCTPVIGERIAVSDEGTFWLALNQNGMWVGHLRDLDAARNLDENHTLVRVPGYRPAFVDGSGSTVTFLRSKFGSEPEVQDAAHMCAADVTRDRKDFRDSERIVATLPPRYRTLGHFASPDGRRCAAVDAQGVCLVTDSIDGASGGPSPGAADLGADYGASDGTLLAYSTDNEVHVCELEGSLSQHEIALLRPPKGYRARKVIVARRYVAVAGLDADNKISRQAWKVEPDGSVEPLFAEISPKTVEGRVPCEEIRLSVSAGEVLCSWRQEPQRLRVVSLTAGAATSIDLVDDARDQIWEFSPTGNRLATFAGYQYPVRIVDTASRSEVAALSGTGAGIGKAWGGWPGDIVFLDEHSLAMVKRAGTYAAWELESFTPIAPPVLTAEDASLDRLFVLPSGAGEHRVLIDAYGDCAWLVTTASHGRSRVTRLAGVHSVLGRWGDDTFVTLGPKGRLAFLDTSHEANVRHLQELAQRST